MHQFVRGTRGIGVKARKVNKTIITFYATPTSDDAKSRFPPPASCNIPISSQSAGITQPLANTTTSSNGDYHLINIRGLITNGYNSADYLAKCTITANPQRSRIISITETWLQADKHFDREITLHSKDYHIVRADHDPSRTTNVPGRQLSSRGGCLLLVSPDLGISSPTSYSNSNCEMAIVDIDKLDMTFITIYRPPPPNSSLSKFKDILNRTRQHIATNVSKGKDYNITVAGDFNFPPSIVSWIVSDDSVFADP